MNNQEQHHPAPMSTASHSERGDVNNREAHASNVVSNVAKYWVLTNLFPNPMAQVFI